MNTKAARLSIVATCLFAVALPAQGTSKGFILESGDHDIAEVITRAANFLGRNLILQSQELMGNPNNNITLQKKLNLDVTGCEEVVSQLAWLKGLVMSPVDPERGIYEFINVRGQRRGEIRATFMKPEEVVKRSRFKVLVSTSLHLKHIDAMRAGQYLRPLLMSHGGQVLIPLAIGGLGTRHALMLRGFADQVANAIRMISMMDVPEANEVDKGLVQRLVKLEVEKRELLVSLQALRQRLDALEGKGGSQSGAKKRK